MEYQEQKLGPELDEINLLQYFQVIWRRKFFIIALCIVAVVATAIVSYRMPPVPPVYRVTAMVSPGLISRTPDVYVDSVDTIKALIEGGSFNTKITESLKLDPSYADMNFKTTLATNTNFLSIFYDAEDPAHGKMIMVELLKQLMEYYRNRTKTGKGVIDNSINTLREKMELLKVTEKKLMTQLKVVEENNKVIMQERNEMLKKSEKDDAVALLLYSNTIQENISYIDNLNASLDANRLDQGSTKEEILNMELDKMKIEGLKIIQEPYSSTRPVPVKLNKKKNIAIAGVTSFFLGIFLAFFIEFIKKVKAYSDTHSESETKG